MCTLSELPLAPNLPYQSTGLGQFSQHQTYLPATLQFYFVSVHAIYDIAFCSLLLTKIDNFNTKDWVSCLTLQMMNEGILNQETF